MRYLPPCLKMPARLLALVVVASCGGSEPTAPTTPPAPVAGSLTLVSGDAQSGVAGAPLDAALVVNVKSTEGAAMSGESVAWSVAGGGGTVSQATSTTGADGNTSVTWTLGGEVGSQSVTATLASFSVTFTAEASAGPVAQVVVTPAEGSLKALDATVQLQAEIQDQFGNAVEGSIVWASADTSVVAVDSTGVAKAVGNGSADVVATVASVTGTATLTVAQEVTTVSASPDNVTLEVGKNSQLEAAAKDANGFTVAGATFTWTSSDTAVATVDTTGVVSGVAEGSAVVRVASGDAADSVAVTVTPDAFRPEVDTEISDSLNVGELEIPEGVTVTLKNDAVINVEGSATISGSVKGDCVATQIVAGGTLTITGSVDNTCATAEDAPAPALVITAGDTLRLEGASLASTGPVVIGDTTEASASAVEGVLAAGEPAVPTYCFVASSQIEAGAATPGFKGWEFRSGARDILFGCRGKLEISGSTFRTADGLDGDDVEGTGEVRGGSGANGGKLTLFGSHGIQFTTHDGRTLIHMGDGGDGGDATSSGLAPVAEGGNGGDAGYMRFITGIVEGWSFVDVEAGTGGDGGNATALASNGEDAAAGPATAGSDAVSRGGHGGAGTVWRQRDNEAVTTYDGHGRGGTARARAGNGGNGNAAHPNGAAGGHAAATGGDVVADEDDYNNHSGGPAGDAILEGGNGGASFGQCTGPGLMGGPGGKGSAVGGRGFYLDDTDGRVILRSFGNGGAGGSGTLPGVGGPPGEDDIPAGQTRVDESSPNFSQGPHGGSCAQDVTLPTTVAVANDGAGHEPFVNMTSVTETRTQFGGSASQASDGPQAVAALGSVTISGNGNFISVTGTLYDDDSFTGGGSGTAAGFSGVSVTLQGRVTRNAQGVITGYSATYTVGANGELFGTPVTYSVSAGG